jgi:hypothetical protein
MTPEHWIALGTVVLAAVGLYWIAHRRCSDREAFKRRRRAHLNVRLERRPDQIVLRNDGEGVAADVRLAVTREKGPGPIDRDARRKLPLAQLVPEDECRLSALVAWEIDKLFHYVITWTDPDGTKRQAESTIHI